MLDENRTEQPQPTPQPAPKPAPQPVVESAADVEKAKGTAWLSYLGILWLIPLLTMKDNSFAKWHAKQGIALDIVTVAMGIVMGILSFIVIGLVIGPIGFAIIFVFRIIGLVKSLGGHYWKCPLGVSKLAEMFKF
ncbi:MAG: DUF4870 domain-containing protein [bacterium]